MAYEVEYTDEFGDWWDGLSVPEQESVAAMVGLLEVKGPHLLFPYSSGIASSRHSHMRGRRTESSTRSTPDGPRYCCWGVTRQATIGGTTNSFQLQIASTLSI